MRAALIAWFALVPFAPASPRAAPPAQGGQGAPGRGATLDSTPSDPAAVGFLESTVDRCVYSLELAGAVRMQANVHATFEVIAAGAKQKPTTLDAIVAYDYTTGTPARQLQKEKAGADGDAQTRLVEQLVFISADNAFLTRPSRAARDWRVTFEQEGEQEGGVVRELVRLDFFPRQQPSVVIDHYSEWYTADGRPTRRVVFSNRPKDGALELVKQEMRPEYDELERRLLLRSLTPLAAEGAMTYNFTYEEKDGFFVLKQLVQENQGWRLTLDFTTIVTRANAPPTDEPPKKGARE